MGWGLILITMKKKKIIIKTKSWEIFVPVPNSRIIQSEMLELSSQKKSFLKNENTMKLLHYATHEKYNL